MVSIITAAGFLLGGYFLLRSFLLIKRKEEEVQDFLVWGVVGLSLIILTVFPQVGDTLAEILNIKTWSNTIFAMAIFLLYMIIFRMHTLNRALDKQISVLNEEIALLRHELENQ